MNIQSSSKATFIMVVFFCISLSVFSQQQITSNAQSTQQADSLFFAKDWEHAKVAYLHTLKDTSHNALAWMRLGFTFYNLGNYKEAMHYYQKCLDANPGAGVKGILLWRKAKIAARENKKGEACDELNNAFALGYWNLQELDSLTDFSSMRSDTCFTALKHKVYSITYPCMEDAHAREFDFWIGDWDVYVTGSNMYAGHNVIQKISGGCALLENWENSAGNGKSINYIDPVTNKWKQAWAGSYANGVQEFVDGEYKDSAMRFVFTATNASGNKVMGRFIFYNEGADQVRQFNETSADGGKTWTTNYDFTYKRRK